MKLGLALMGLLAAANAFGKETVISTKEITLHLKSPFQLNVICHPGIPSNGHNFPTPSGLDLVNFTSILRDSNLAVLGASDPRLRLGDTCKELRSELEADIPGDLVIKQVRSERVELNNQICVRVRSEQVDAKIGEFDFSGSADFILEELAAENCTTFL